MIYYNRFFSQITNYCIKNYIAYEPMVNEYGQVRRLGFSIESMYHESIIQSDLVFVLILEEDLRLIIAPHHEIRNDELLDLHLDRNQANEKINKLKIHIKKTYIDEFGL